jgi:hypothetical protein
VRSLAPRFKVINHQRTPSDRPYFSISDGQADQYHMPPNAVSLHFGDRSNAVTVCEILNLEWVEFLRAPW